MKIAVCVKEVPSASSRRVIDETTLRLSRDGDCELNEYDANAVEAALTLAPETGAEVVALSMGPAHASMTLRRCLALGAHRAVLLHDVAAAGSDLIATSAALARLIELESPGLVLFGQQAEDSDGGLLFAAVAERLQLPSISKASELEVHSHHLRAWRTTEDGRERVELPLPAVVAVSRAANEPRKPSVRGAIEARKRSVEQRSLAEIGLDPAAVGAAGSRTVVVSLATPELTRERRRFCGGASEAADAIMAFLSDKGILHDRAVGPGL